MFLAELFFFFFFTWYMFLCLSLSSSTEQCSGNTTTYRALIIWQMLHFLWSKWAVLSALYLFSLLPQLTCVMFWHLLSVTIHTSLKSVLFFSYRIEHFQMSRINRLCYLSPVLLPHSPAENLLQHPDTVAFEQMLKLHFPCCSAFYSGWRCRLNWQGINLTFGHRC